MPKPIMHVRNNGRGAWHHGSGLSRVQVPPHATVPLHNQAQVKLFQGSQKAHFTLIRPEDLELEQNKQRAKAEAIAEIEANEDDAFGVTKVKTPFEGAEPNSEESGVKTPVGGGPDGGRGPHEKGDGGEVIPEPEGPVDPLNHVVLHDFNHDTDEPKEAKVDLADGEIVTIQHVVKNMMGENAVIKGGWITLFPDTEHQVAYHGWPKLVADLREDPGLFMEPNPDEKVE